MPDGVGGDKAANDYEWERLTTGAFYAYHPIDREKTFLEGGLMMTDRKQLRERIRKLIRQRQENHDAAIFSLRWAVASNNRGGKQIQGCFRRRSDAYVFVKKLRNEDGLMAFVTDLANRQEPEPSGS